MKTFLSLLKVDLLRLFGINKAFKSGKGGRKVVGLVALVLIVVLFIIAEASGITFGMASLLPSGERYKALALVMMLYFVMVLFMTIGTSKVLFGCSDYDMLMSLPVKPIAVILSKIAYVYLIDYLFAFGFLMPSAIICGIIEGSVLTYTLCGFLYAFFLPLLPMVIGLGVGTLVHYIVSRIRNKTLLGVIGSILFIAIYLFFVFGTNDIDDNQINAVFSLPLFAPIRFVAFGVAGNILSIIVFVVAMSLIAVFVVWLIAKNYKKINQSISAKVGGGSFTMTKQVAETPARTLFIRELKLFFSSSTNIMNTLIGGVIGIAISAMFIFKGGINGLVAAEEIPPEEIAEATELLSKILLSVFPFFAVMFGSMNTYASYAISLEGKRLWILKSLPIRAKDILRAKMQVALLLSCPLSIIATVLFGIGLKATVLEVVIASLIVCAYLLCDIAIGLNVNLKFSFFDWKSEAEVVKRGTSVLLSMIIGMVGALVFGVLQFILTSVVGSIIGWGIMLAMLIGLDVLFIFLLFTNADEKMRKLGEN